jgi:succinyl-CoA synthetase alpha subunit
MQEEKAAEYIANGMTKPVASYVAGRITPQGKRMGHAGAIIRGSAGTVEGKCVALRDAGAAILKSPIEVLDWAAKNDIH